MAGSKFSVNTLLGWLSRFLKSMTSPIAGYDIRDVKVKEESDGDVYSSLFMLETSNLKDADGNPISDISGEKIDLNILLKVINAQAALGPLYKGMNELSAFDKAKPNKFAQTDLLNILLGSDRISGQGNNAQVDNSLAGAKSRHSGLLGIDFSAANQETAFADLGTYNNTTWGWGVICKNYLKCALECETPGKDYGAIQNIPLADCVNLIAEYLAKMGIIANASEAKIDLYTLIKPILADIQINLCKYYDNAYNKYVANEKEPDIADMDDQEDSKEGTEEESQPTQNPQQQVEDKLTSNMGNEPYRPGPSQSKAQGVFPGMSKQIKVTLKKIQGSTAFDVLSLESNYSPVETLDDLDDILIQDEFMDALTEDPQTFAIAVDDDGYDIDVCETCETNPCDSLGDALRAGISMYRNLYTLHWMAKGNDMMKTHLLSEEMYSELIGEIDALGELLVEKCGKSIPLDFECEYIAVQEYKFQEALDVMQVLINNYLAALDYAYPNQTTDVQSVMDEWLRYWNKQINYFIKNQEE